MPKNNSSSDKTSHSSIYHTPNVQGEKKMPSFKYTPTTPPKKK